MSAVLAPRRLTVPAVRFEPREVLVATLPFYLRDAAAPPAALPATQVSPPLLSFDGDTFMDDFLAASGAGTRTALPELLAWRDWAEPPAAMLDPGGAPLYPSSIRRAAPLKIHAEIEPPGTLDADGVPHDTPSWLRKLYLPLHLRFTFVAFDVVCRRAGWPMLDKARVLASGAVVRRLVRDPSGERWQDWLSADGKIGLWFELNGGLPADPDVIPSSAYARDPDHPQDAIIARRLGLPAEAPLALKLDSAKLGLLPVTVGTAATHCSLYGLVPVYSAAQQAGDDTPGLSDAETAQAFHDRALATLTADWADDATLRTRLGPAVQTLLDRTVLPPGGDEPTALGNIAAAADPLHPPSESQIRAAVPGIARVALLRYQQAATPGASDADPASGGVAGFWNQSTAAQAARDPRVGSLAPAGLNSTRFSNTADWDTLVVGHLRTIARTRLCATGTPSGDAAVGQAMLALLLVRLRRLRLALLSRLHEQVFGAADKAQLTLVQPQILDGVGYELPAATAGGLAAEIDAILGLDGVRTAEAAPSWPPLDLSAPLDRATLLAHEAGRALEGLLAPIDAAGGDGGSAYEGRIAKRADEIATGVAGYFGLPSTGRALYRLREIGLDLLEQPSRGLLVFPGTAPQHADFATMASDVAGAYTSDAALSRSEAKRRAAVHRLRYDHDSLYAVWCWVRVAGRTDCEKEQVLWTARSEPFSVAEPSDVLGAKPVTIQLPDLPRLIRDIPRIAKARAQPFAAINTPPNSGFNVGDDPKETRRAWGVGWICSFGIPVLTICAFILFSIIFSILIILPGFAWMLLLKFCIPVPVPKKS